MRAGCWPRRSQRIGRAGKQAVRNLQRAQARLALELSRGGRYAYPLRLRVLVARRRLDAMGHPEAAVPMGRRRDLGALVVTVALVLLLALVITIVIQLIGAS